MPLKTLKLPFSRANQILRQNVFVYALLPKGFDQTCYLMPFVIFTTLWLCHKVLKNSTLCLSKGSHLKKKSASVWNFSKRP